MTDETTEHVDFQDSHSFARWLERLPAKRRTSSAGIIAARTALRVAPLLSRPQPRSGNSIQEQSFARLVFASLWSAASAWTTIKYPRRVYGTDVDNAARSAASIAEAAAATNTFTAFAGLAAAYAARSLEFNSFQAASEATKAANAVAINAAEKSDIWFAISKDAEALVRGVKPQSLAGRPLWPAGEPDWALQHRQQLESALALTGSHWQPWFDWYHRRLDGRELADEAEILFAALPVDPRSKAIADQNQMLAQRIAELEFNAGLDEATQDEIPDSSEAPVLPPAEEIPVQQRAATRFGSDAQGRIDIALDAPGDIVDPDQINLYSEARAKLGRLIALGENVIGDLKDPASGCLAVMPTQLRDVTISLLWSRANALRRKLSAHDQALERQKATGRFDNDADTLNVSAAEALRDFIETYNIFVVSDPKGIEYDRKRLGLSDRKAIADALAIAESLNENLSATENIATNEAKSALAEQLRAARPESENVHDEQATALAKDTWINFVVNLVGQNAFRILKGEANLIWTELRKKGYLAAGGLVFIEMMKFIADNAIELKQYLALVFVNPALSQIIDAVVWFVSQL